jgi:hypothetical protein
LEEAQAELNAKCEMQGDQLLNENQDEMQENAKHIFYEQLLKFQHDGGSALASWRRLRKLKPAIKRVLVNLCLETDYQSKKDYKQLQERMLK